MSPSLADALAERLLERLPPERAYDRADLAEAAHEGAPLLPRTVRHFLERMMTRRMEIERERLGVLRQPWLDYEHEEVRRAEEALIEAVRRHVHIPAEAWERVLRHACGRVAAHLVRPAPTLEAFVFGGGPPEAPGDPAAGETTAHDDNGSDLLPARVVRRRLSYFAAYPYLREAVNAYVEQRDVASFPRERLGALLRRVDERMCSSHDTESWLRLLQPLFALARVAYPNHDGLPAELLEAFFEEKKADVPLQRLRAARSEHDLSALSPSALGEILTPAARPPASADAPAREAPAPSDTSDTPADSRTSSGGAPPAEEEAGPAAPPRDRAPDREPSESEPESVEGDQESVSAPPNRRDQAGGSDDAAAPLWKRFLGTSQAEAPANDEEVSASSSDDARPRWQQFSTDAPEGDAPGTEAPSEEAPAAETPPALEPLEEEVLGGADHRARFVRELFDGSTDAYGRVLHRLRDAESWQTATQIIARDVFRAHGVNIYSDAARSFTNAVEARFR